MLNSARWIRASVLVLLGVLAAWSWLFVISKWGPATRIDILTFKAGVTSKVMRTLLKPAQATGHAGHTHDAASISGIYATPEYYAMTEQSQEAAKYLPEKFTVFYVFEDIHVGDLPAERPEMMLRLDDGRQFSPIDATVVRDSYHHRATVVRFRSKDENGSPIINAKSSSFELIAHDPAVHVQQTMQWSLPIIYPKDLNPGSDLSLPTLFALLAGLVAVLSPCLLQLTVYYTFALAGISMQQTGAEHGLVRGQVIRTALCFIAGFTLVFCRWLFDLLWRRALHLLDDLCRHSRFCDSRRSCVIPLLVRYRNTVLACRDFSVEGSPSSQLVTESGFRNRPGLQCCPGFFRGDPTHG